MEGERGFFVRVMVHLGGFVMASFDPFCSGGEASLDCLYASSGRLRRFLLRLKPLFLCSLSLPKTESGLDETFLPREMQECDKECKQASVMANNHWPSSIMFFKSLALYIQWVSSMRYIRFRQNYSRIHLSLDVYESHT